MTAATLERLPYRVLTPNSNTPEWLKLRQSGVGASESPAILGDSAWGTPITVYEGKIAEEVVDITTDLMEFGHLAEAIIEQFMLNHPERYGYIGEIIPAEGLLQSIEWPWLLGTLDRQVRTPLGFTVPLEFKSTNDFVASDWRVENEYGGADEYVVPKKYQVQVQQQMAVKGAPFAYVAAWLGKDKLVLIRVDRDDDYIDEYLVGHIGDFWNYNVSTRTPPPATANDDLWKIWPGDPAADAIVADDDLKGLLNEWRQLTENARQDKKTIKQLKFTITDTMGDALEIVNPDDGNKVIHTLKPQNTARKTDFDKLAIMYPDAYEDCVIPAGRTRVHRATKGEIE